MFGPSLSAAHKLHTNCCPGHSHFNLPRTGLSADICQKEKESDLMGQEAPAKTPARPCALALNHSQTIPILTCASSRRWSIKSQNLPADPATSTSRCQRTLFHPQVSQVAQTRRYISTGRTIPTVYLLPFRLSHESLLSIWIQILTNSAAAMARDSRVVICDMLVPELVEPPLDEVSQP